MATRFYCANVAGELEMLSEQLHIPVEGGQHSVLKPDTIPVGRRTAFRSEGGQYSGDSGHPM